MRCHLHGGIAFITRIKTTILALSSEHFIVALLVGAIVLSLFAAWHDIRTRRIPNRLLKWGILYFLAIFIAMAFLLPIGNVLKGFLFALLGMVLGGAFLYFPYQYRQVGAGDVKLMMVYGLLLGPKGVILALLNGAIVGGIWALALAWRIGGLKHMFYNMKFMARTVWLSGGKDMGWDLRSEGAIAMPYGVALAAGAILVCVWQLNLHLGRLFGVDA